MLIVLHCWTLLQASMNPNNNNAKCSQTSYSRSVSQIEGQGVILWPQVMVRIKKILKIKNKHVILESAFLWVSATTDSANSGCNSVNSANSANLDPNSAESVSNWPPESSCKPSQHDRGSTRPTWTRPIFKTLAGCHVPP